MDEYRWHGSKQERDRGLELIKSYVKGARSNDQANRCSQRINELILEFQFSSEELMSAINGLPGPRPRPLSGKWTSDDVGEFWPKTFATPLHAQWVIDALKLYSKGTTVDAVKLAKAINDGKFSPPP